jgi:hypothetical protein
VQSSLPARNKKERTLRVRSFLLRNNLKSTVLETSALPQFCGAIRLLPGKVRKLTTEVTE